MRRNFFTANLYSFVIYKNSYKNGSGKHHLTNTQSGHTKTPASFLQETGVQFYSHTKGSGSFGKQEFQQPLLLAGQCPGTE